MIHSDIARNERLHGSYRRLARPNSRRFVASRDLSSEFEFISIQIAVN